MKTKYLVSFGLICIVAGALGKTAYDQFFNQHITVYAGPEDPLEAWSEYGYIIWKYNSTMYGAINMSTNMVDGRNTNKTRLELVTMNNLTAGGSIFCKGITWNTSITLSNSVIVTESYLGQIKTYSNQGKWLLTQLTADPNTSGWGATENGRWWYNTVDKKVKYWDGTEVKVLGVDCPISYSSTFTLQNVLTEQTLFSLTPANITHLYNIYIDLNALTKNCTIKCYMKIDGTNWREMPAMALTNLGAENRKGLALHELWIDALSSFQVRITSIQYEGTTRSIPYRYFVEVY